MSVAIRFSLFDHVDIQEEAELHTVFANFAQVKATQEEVMLLLGTSHSRPSDQNEIRVALNERILLSPSTAKRLSVLLNKVIQVYESEFGSLDDEVSLRDRLRVEKKINC